ncbi:histone-lysine N-methyltransferase ASHH2 [Forsythia ovata]|uniref:Histone-lysine N-methyltransferase ASHH2 n=1 Tax=Forsythia ovata TaxID=205694 RepID=A0ABD1U5R5_9LAMI
MLTEISVGKNACDLKEVSPMVNHNCDSGNLSVSPQSSEPSHVRAEPSIHMSALDLSGADLLLAALDSISSVENPGQRADEAKDNMKFDASNSYCEVDPSRQRDSEGKYCSESVHVAEPSLQRDCEGQDVVKVDDAPETKPLIVYSSSRRRSGRNLKLNHNNEDHKPDGKCRRTANKNKIWDLNSLQISRRRRSAFCKRDRSSVWGSLGNIIEGLEENVGLDMNLDNGKRPKRAKDGLGNGRRVRNQTGRISRKPMGKSCTPTSNISLKVKIGKTAGQYYSTSNDIENFQAKGNTIPNLFKGIETKLEGGVPRSIGLQCEGNLEKLILSDASVLNIHLDEKDIVDNLSANVSVDPRRIISQEEVDKSGAANDNRCSDPGTSPDSEVINSVPDFQIFRQGSKDNRDIPILSKACVSSGEVASLSLPPKSTKKGKKKEKCRQAGDCSVESKLFTSEIMNNAQESVELGQGQGQGLGDDSYYINASMNTAVKAHLDTFGTEVVSGDPLHCSRVTDLGTSCEASKVQTSTEINPSGLVSAVELSESQICEELFPSNKGQKIPKGFRANGGSKSKSEILDLSSKNRNASKKKGSRCHSAANHNVKEGNGCCIFSGVEAGNQSLSDLGESGYASQRSSGETQNLELFPCGARDQYATVRSAWVLCDDCDKWRRIPSTLADQIEETNCKWTCKDNKDKNFADCSIPQEKSDAEINKELDISDASCEEDAYDAFMKSKQNQSTVAQHSSWMLIKSNLFLHRSRKNQTIDEIMVCHCKTPSEGRRGCEDKCLNRMLNIECIQGTCPCGELCSNQQFQKHKYAKLKWFRCGKKGYGLQVVEDITEGQFLIEYVGEVLDMNAYEMRQREYALKGHKHFYFMTLNGSEVIDACAKGNLGRFINHSCDPNCRTEKWMVNGEVCVGLFALRDIKKGDELTFDYNYVRVFGAAAKKCVCGSPNCRGYIGGGGDPLNSEVIVHDDSDEEYPEPVMFCEDNEMNYYWNDIMKTSLNDREIKSVKETAANEDRMEQLESALLPLETALEIRSSENLIRNEQTSVKSQVRDTVVHDECQLEDSSSADVHLDMNKETRGSMNRYASAGLKVESEEAEHSGFHVSTPTALPRKSLSDVVETKRKLKAGIEGRDELAKSETLSNRHRSSSSVKKGKLKTNSVNDKKNPDVAKSHASPYKSNKLLELSLYSHVEAVEATLNELLNPDGGISKRKDASRGYLKLLFLTAASGNNVHGEAIQSNRDLSMILDALLKTKSRTVLIDIINKNGLQMLHNIMKRYRREFIKTPILRKLLKVLEYLAMREILNLEHINGGPPRPGVESFRDSILTLTEHADKQVHQIARNFRDRWIPRPIRKNCCMDRDHGRMEFPRSPNYNRFPILHDASSHRVGKPSIAAPREVITGVSEGSHASSSSDCGANGTITRKRKSRWDSPSASYPHPRIRINVADDGEQNTDEDPPPGFNSPLNTPMIPSDACSTAIDQQERAMHMKHTFDVVLGDSQQRFISRLSVSYGVPFLIVQQFGAPQAESSNGWAVAPGLPFHPFPPLPPYPRGKIDPPTSAKCASMCEPAESAEQGFDNRADHPSGQNHASTSMDLPDMRISGANVHTDFRPGGSYNMGRKYLRQQQHRWNNSKLAPPWVRNRSGWGYLGNGSRNGMSNVGFGSGANEY